MTPASEAETPAALVRVAVPATAANLGPGFDALGLALDLCNEVTLRLGHAGDESGVDTITGEGSGQLPRDTTNLALHAAATLFQQIGREPPPLRATLHNCIPLARGLGSSAAAVIGGIVAANVIAGRPLDNAKLLALAADIEGHPDNVAPALLGGLVIAATDHSAAPPRIVTHRLPAPRVDLALCIPERPLATAAARRVLPQQVPLATAVHNVGRVALLVAAFATGDYRHLRLAMDDRLHQPPRAAIFPPLAPVIAAALAAGAAGACLSGAGSALLAVVPPEHPAPETVAAAMVAACEDAGYPAQPALVRPRDQGAVITTVAAPMASPP